MKKIISLLILALFLSACTAFNPIPKGYTGPVANIEDTFTNDTGRSAHYFILSKINKKAISDSFGATRRRYAGMGMNFDPVMVDRDVLPEHAKFTIQGFKFFPTDAQAMFGDSMMIEKIVYFTPTAGEKYYIKGSLSKGRSDVWIENTGGERVSSHK